ncbi:NAD-dependent epimerase/dehydratase family protein [Haloarcula halobia]|uniref:NAD-dependent epimerase/dehydratase family protein n=1 Tax=Haloarcula halobia TaxID=3033388 RepID=UPI0023ED9746|nr:NAD-dependent epimerase/dehydratase family protein [Halomicroarcula sp. XH51]
MSDRILVTGAAGFVGTHVVVELINRGDDTIVTATDIQNSPPDRYSHHLGDRLRYRQGDITDEDFVNDLLSENFDYIFHLAAVVGVNEYVENPLYLTDVNIIATRNILNRIRDEDVRFVFASTSEVYGKNPDVPWDEDNDRILGPASIDRWSHSTSKGFANI